MAGNTSTKKMYNRIAPAPVHKASPQRTAKSKNMGAVNEGQIDGYAKFADPMVKVTAVISGMHGLHYDIGEASGFITDGYIDKQGTPYGEAAKFNYLPPGMDISNQENAEINMMPLRQLTAESYPGDGWMPAPRDLPE